MCNGQSLGTLEFHILIIIKPNTIMKNIYLILLYILGFSSILSAYVGGHHHTNLKEWSITSQEGKLMALFQSFNGNTINLEDARGHLHQFS